MADSMPNSFHRATRARVSRVVGMAPGDDRMSTAVALELWVDDVPGGPARFVFPPERADEVGRALIDSASRTKDD